MMHFVHTFSIMLAYGVRLIAIKEARNYGKIEQISGVARYFKRGEGGINSTFFQA